MQIELICIPHIFRITPSFSRAAKFDYVMVLLSSRQCLPLLLLLLSEPQALQNLCLSSSLNPLNSLSTGTRLFGGKLSSTKRFCSSQLVHGCVGLQFPFLERSTYFCECYAFIFQSELVFRKKEG